MKSLIYREPKWRVRDVLHALGTQHEIAAMLEERGYPVPVGTVSSWSSRNSVPGAWMPVIIDLAMKARVIGSIDDLRELT